MQTPITRAHIEARPRMGAHTFPRHTWNVARAHVYACECKWWAGANLLEWVHDTNICIRARHSMRVFEGLYISVYAHACN